MIASAANLPSVSEMPLGTACKHIKRDQIEFLTCRISYKMCDTQNGRNRASGISDLPSRFQ
jgi:hypothetical protein